MSDCPQKVGVGLYYQTGTKDIVLEEVVKTEGVPFTLVEDPVDLDGFSSLVLGDTPLSRSQISSIEDFVDGGGILVAARSDEGLEDVFGTRDTGLTQEDGYLHLGGKTIGDEVSYGGRLQIFGSSRLYEGGEAVVRLSPSEGYGGIIGAEGGNAFLVAFDISRTFLEIQQPASRIGRAYDTTRVDRGLCEVPQLDLMRRLFVNLVLGEAGPPLPRRWYFPDGAPSLLLLGGDQDGSDYGRLAVVREIVREHDVPYTLFATPMSQPMSRQELEDVAAAGIEIALHPDFSHGRPFTGEEFSSQLRAAEDQSGAEINGARNHALRWGGVLEVPVWVESNDLDYDSNLGLSIPLDKPQKAGYFVGGGLPYYFIHPETYLRINVLEQPVTAGDDVLFWDHLEIVVDLDDPGWLPEYLHTDSRGSASQGACIPGRSIAYTAGLGLTEEDAFLLSKRFIDDSLEGFHTVQCYICHPLYLASGRTDEPYHHSDTFFVETIQYARRKGVHLMDHGSWNRFWRRREATRYEGLSWDPCTRTLEFSVRSPQVIKGLAHLIPLLHAGRAARVTVDGVPKQPRTFLLGRRKFAMIVTDLAGEPVQVSVRYA